MASEQYTEKAGDAGSKDKQPTSVVEVQQEERQRKGQKYDKIALWLLLIVQLVYLFLSGYAMYDTFSDWDDKMEFTGDMMGEGSSITVTPARRAGGGNAQPFNNQTRWMFLYATGVAVGVNVVLIFLIPFISEFLVWLGPAMFILLLLCAAGMFAYLKVWISVGIAVTMALILALIVYLMRTRMKLGKFLLQTAGRTASKHWSVFGLTLFGLLIQAILSVLNITASFAIFLRFQPLHQECQEGVYCSWAVTWAGLIWAFAAHAWLSGMVANTMLVALAGGPFSYIDADAKVAYYFQNEKGQRGAWYALRQAVSKRSGSIALGSLVVALIELLDWIVSEALSGGGWVAILTCGILSLLTSALETLAELFNVYVYIFMAGQSHPQGDLLTRHVAIGKRKNGVQVIGRFEESFYEAGLHCAHFIVRVPKKDKKGDGSTSELKRLARSHGIAVIVNDNIVGFALFMACLCTALVSLGFTYAYMYIVNKDAVPDNNFDWAILAYAFFLGLIIGLVFTSALKTGVSTLFVCMSEDITLLKAANPEFDSWLSGETDGDKPKESYAVMYAFLTDKANGKAAEGNSKSPGDVDEGGSKG